MRRPLLIGLIAVAVAVVVVVALAALSVIARQNAIAEHRTAAAALADAVDTSQAAVAEADQALTVAADPLLDVTAVETATAERDAAAAALGDAETLAGVDPEQLDTERIRALTDGIRAAAAEVGTDDEAVFQSLEALVSLTAGATAAVDAANPEAENQPRIAFRAAAADLDLARDEQTAEYLIAYLEAAHALETSHAEEVAEKAGPLLDRRLAVQDFARSLSGGVLLDFDWAVTVNGYGTGGSYGGTSYWFAADGGYATITLSDSVASMWPAAGVRSLVAHEVGHAILARPDCNALFFDSEFAAAGEEPWATAWAIGQGYTADGNGESIYGRPPDALITMSAECR